VAGSRRYHHRAYGLIARIDNPQHSLRAIGLTLAYVTTLLGANGCSPKTYQFGRFHPGAPDGVALQPVVVEYGGEHPTLDKIGRVVGLPARVFTLNSKVNNHNISPETVEKVTTYLEQNDLTDVVVSVNEYDPKGQWQRLKANYRIDPFWRYSAGTLSWLGYSMFPNRVFGGDEYNPYTNTLILTSDVPARALAEAAYAKDIHTRTHPGAYAVAGDLPLLSMYRQSRATSDVLGYARVQQDQNTETEAYHVLYPHIGSTAFGPAAHFVPVAGPFLSVGGALVGHAAGRTVTALQPKPATTPAAKSVPETTGDSDKALAAGETRPAPVPAPSGDHGVIMAGYEEAVPATTAMAPGKPRKPTPADPTAGRSE